MRFCLSSKEFEQECNAVLLLISMHAGQATPSHDSRKRHHHAF